MRLWNTAKTTSCCSWTALGETPASIAKAVLNLAKKGFAIDQTARLNNVRFDYLSRIEGHINYLFGKRQYISPLKEGRHLWMLRLRAA